MVSKLGNFELIDELGGGAWGKVYLARQVTLGGRLVAVKVLWPHLAADERARQRFLDEAQSMGLLNHRNIANVIDYGEEDGTCYFAMEYVEGKSLGEVIAREGPMSAGQVAELGAQIADALDHAHSQGMVHRDIKPGNILIDEQGRPVVTDFGIAKIGEGTGLTATGASIGTPEYMSPEQAEGNPVDGRSDIYSLGVVLYHMVCGQAPFGGTTPFAVGMKHVNEVPRDPRELRPDCPEWLASIILQALAKQPFERFGTGQEMAATLRAARPVARRTMEIDREPPVFPPAQMDGYRAQALSIAKLDAGAAIPMLEYLWRADASDIYVGRALALCYVAAERVNDAVNVYEAIHAQCPQDFDITARLAHLLAMVGDKERARELGRQVWNATTSSSHLRILTARAYDPLLRFSGLALLLAFLFPFAGLVLGIVGMRRASMGSTSLKLCTTAVVVSLVSLLYFLVAVVVAVVA